MTPHDREKVIGNYIMWKQDIEKYKKILLSNSRKNNYIKIDWTFPKKLFKKFMQRWWNKQPMKSYRMANRLRKLSKNNNQ